MKKGICLRYTWTRLRTVSATKILIFVIHFNG